MYVVNIHLKKKNNKNKLLKSSGKLEHNTPVFREDIQRREIDNCTKQQKLIIKTFFYLLETLPIDY